MSISEAVQEYLSLPTTGEVEQAFDEIDMHAHRTRPYRLTKEQLASLRKAAEPKTGKVNKHLVRR